MIVFNHPNWPSSQEIDRLFDRLTEQNRMSVVYTLSINKVINNVIRLQITELIKANIFRSIFPTVSSTVIHDTRVTFQKKKLSYPIFYVT